MLLSNQFIFDGFLKVYLEGTDEDGDEEKVINIAKEKADHASGASTCKVHLLQKYLMSIEAKKSYVGLTSLQFDGDSIVTNLNDNM